MGGNVQNFEHDKNMGKNYIDKIAEVLIETRMSKDKSIRCMAKAMRRSPATISNWEEGISVPDLSELLEWFDVLGINPTPYILRLCNPNAEKYGVFDDDEKNKQNLMYFIQDVCSPEMRRKLAFNLLGYTGSYFEAQIDLMTAHNLCQLDIKVTNAWLIYHNYIMAKNRKELTNNNTLFDESKFHDAILKAEQSAFAFKDGYVQGELKKDT